MSRYLRAYTRQIGFACLLLLLPFLLPPFGVSSDVGTLVTATSTIFAIVAGFFIADAMSNYLRLQTLIAEENSALISIAGNAKAVDKKNCVAVHQAIDAYMIAQLDLGTLNHFSQTQKQVDQLHVSIHSLKTNSENSLLFDHVLAMEEKVITTRQEMTLAAKKTLTKVHWGTLITLAVLVAITVLAIRNGTWLTNVVAGLMILGTQAVLVILRDVDNNFLLEEKLAYQNPREVFHAVAQPPYYPHFAPVKYRIPDQDGSIRIGKKA